MRKTSEHPQPKVSGASKERAFNPRMNAHFGKCFGRLIKLQGALRVLVGGLTCLNCTYGLRVFKMYCPEKGVGENDVHSMLT